MESFFTLKGQHVIESNSKDFLFQLIEQSGTNTMPSIVNVYYQYVNLISIKLLHILLIYQLKSI